MGTPWMWLPVSPLPEHEMSSRWNRAAVDYVNGDRMACCHRPCALLHRRPPPPTSDEGLDLTCGRNTPAHRNN